MTRPTLTGLIAAIALTAAAPTAAAPLNRTCPPSPRNTYVLTACQARDVVALIADERTGHQLTVDVYSCHRVNDRGFQCAPRFHSPRWTYTGRAIVHIKRLQNSYAVDFRLKATNRQTGRTRNVRWSDR